MEQGAGVRASFERVLAVVRSDVVREWQVCAIWWCGMRQSCAGQTHGVFGISSPRSHTLLVRGGEVDVSVAVQTRASEASVATRGQGLSNVERADGGGGGGGREHGVSGRARTLASLCTRAIQGGRSQLALVGGTGIIIFNCYIFRAC